MTEPFLAAIVLFGGNIIKEIPAHNHATTHTLTSTPAASTYAATTNTPASTLVTATLPVIGSGPAAQTLNGYAPANNSATLAPCTVSGTVNIGVTGGSQPFDIMQPYFGINNIIAKEGVLLTRND